MKKLNFALFGLGKFGRHYARLLQDMPDANLRAVITKTPQSDDKRGVFLNHSIFRSIDRDIIFESSIIDCVVIATPPFSHFSLIKKSLLAGKHVLVEKPMVVSIKEASDLQKIAKNFRGVFMTGYQYLYNDYIRYLKKEISKGTFGNILYMTAEHMLSPERDDTDCFWDAAPHTLSIFQYLFQPKKIIDVCGKKLRTNAFGKSGKKPEDFATAIVKFNRGPILNIITSWSGIQKTRKIILIAEKAKIIFDDTEEKNKLTIVKNNGSLWRPKIKSSEPLRNELEYFIKCVRKLQRPLTDFNFSFLITKWLEIISGRI